MLRKKYALSIALCVPLTAALGFAAPANALPPPIVVPTVAVDGDTAKDAHLVEVVEASPDLKVKIYRHKVDALKDKPEAWTFITDGLAASGQEEIVLTVLKKVQDGVSEKDSDYPKLPIKLFDAIGKLAAQQKIVSVGGYTEFRTTGFLAPQFRGVIYAPVPSLLGVPVPAKSIAMVPITQEEIDIYQVAGALRVMARLGAQAEFYPCPTWCDRDRVTSTSAAEVAEMKEDPIFKSAKAQTYSLTAVQKDKTLSLRVNPKSAETLLAVLKELPEDSALRLALGLDPREDSLLVWQSKANNDNSMIAPVGSKYKAIGITFLAILPTMAKDEILSGNDGCALMFTKNALGGLIKALENHYQYLLPMGTDSGFKCLEMVWE